MQANTGSGAVVSLLDGLKYKTDWKQMLNEKTHKKRLAGRWCSWSGDFVLRKMGEDQELDHEPGGPHLC